jgi:tRNA threonylcarbamoyladenosine biosynthesis protein TsaE
MQVSIDDLQTFAKKFWDNVTGQRLFAFHGAMGAGKTTIIAALCREKGVVETVSSPTFSIINEYGFIEKNLSRKIYHLDLYRLNNSEEIMHAGVEECIFSNDICFVEWPQNATGLFDEHTVHIFIDIADNTTRQIKIEELAEADNNSIPEHL